MLPSSQHFRGVEGHDGTLGWNQEELTSFNYSHKPAQNQPQGGQCIVGALLVLKRAMGNLGLTRLTMTRTWGKPPPSPLQYTLRLSMGATSKWLFVSGFPNGSPEIPIVETLTTLGVHNFMCRSPIVIRSKENLQPLSRAFQRYVARHLHTRKLGRFPNFSGWESNCQFDSWPFF